MYPSWSDDLRRQRVDELARLAERARLEGRTETRARRVRRVRGALGARLLKAGWRIGGEQAAATAGLDLREC